MPPRSVGALCPQGHRHAGYVTVISSVTNKVTKIMQVNVQMSFVLPISRNYSVCVSITPVERAAAGVARGTTSSPGGPAPFLPGTRAKVGLLRREGCSVFPSQYAYSDDDLTF